MLAGDVTVKYVMEFHWGCIMVMQFLMKFQDIFKEKTQNIFAISTKNTYYYYRHLQINFELFIASLPSMQRVNNMLDVTAKLFMPYACTHIIQSYCCNECSIYMFIHVVI